MQTNPRPYRDCLFDGGRGGGMVVSRARLAVGREVAGVVGCEVNVVWSQYLGTGLDARHPELAKSHRFPNHTNANRVFDHLMRSPGCIDKHQVNHVLVRNFDDAETHVYPVVCWARLASPFVQVQLDCFGPRPGTARLYGA